MSRQPPVARAAILLDPSSHLRGFCSPFFKTVVSSKNLKEHNHVNICKFQSHVLTCQPQSTTLNTSFILVRVFQAAKIA